jgi:hypothetical protein
MFRAEEREPAMKNSGREAWVRFTVAPSTGFDYLDDDDDAGGRKFH